ncbi:hypothetical protein DL93DRAFT_261560 [Clavulina sp. PMI_390]|nr:hypothetical protein DL93DRAFT_261560 [Clavulina sp. PMI_390]
MLSSRHKRFDIHRSTKRFRKMPHHSQSTTRSPPMDRPQDEGQRQVRRFGYARALASFLHSSLRKPPQDGWFLRQGQWLQARFHSLRVDVSSPSVVTSSTGGHLMLINLATRLGWPRLLQAIHSRRIWHIFHQRFLTRHPYWASATTITTPSPKRTPQLIMKRPYEGQGSTLTHWHE